MQLDVSDSQQIGEVFKIFAKLNFFTDFKQKKVADSVRAAGLDCFTHLLTSIALNGPFAATVSKDWFNLVYFFLLF